MKKAPGDSGDLCETEVEQKNVKPCQSRRVRVRHGDRQTSVCRSALIERPLAGISTVTQEIFCPEWKQISDGWDMFLNEKWLFCCYCRLEWRRHVLGWTVDV
jgi:hypothetical protein